VEAHSLYTYEEQLCGFVKYKKFLAHEHGRSGEESGEQSTLG
jgi:hypothetical protein